MRWDSWIIAACCALFVAVVVIPAGVYDKGWDILSGPDAAAWVQAAGSIVAIFISVFGVMWLQDRERKRAAKAARVEWLEALNGIAKACDDLIQEQHAVTAPHPIGDVFKLQARPNRLKTVHEAISATSLEKAHPGELALAIIQLRHVTGKAHRLIAGHPDNFYGHHRVTIDLSDCAERSAASVRTIREALVDARQ